jgi:tetratricopeptide (TPR) repeat protein
VKGWEKATLAEIGSLPGPGTLQWTPVRRHFGILAFGINAYTAEQAGQDVVEQHTEERLGHEEAYLVLAGRATFTLDGERTEADAGTIVFIRDPKVERSAVAEEPGTTVLALGGKPGQAYTPSPWEYWFAATPLSQAGDHEAAIETISAGFEIHPEHPMLYYQLACYEALAGKTEDAIEHLNRAAAESKLMREWAQTDDDFASIRSDPRFPAPPS